MLSFFTFSSNNRSNYNKNNNRKIASILSLSLIILLIQLPSIYSITREYDLTITYEPLKYDTSRLAIHGNGQHPLPTIICYSGDLVRIKIRNKINNKIENRKGRRKRGISNDKINAITFHFHGILQRNDNYTFGEHGNKINNGLADGVPFVNQWPTLPNETYIYEFTIDNQPGTYFYHSHWALSTITGHGAFIVRDKPPKIYGDFEDHQFTTTEIKTEKEPFVIMFSDLWAKSDQALVQGLIDQKNFTWIGPPSDLLINGNTFGNTVFLVEPKKTYRLRIIGATTLEDMVFGIYNHNMTIIEVDGSYVKPVTVDSLQVSPGERYSVLITTDQTPGDYNILGEIRLRNDTITNAGRRDPTATLRYVSSSLPPPPESLNVPTLPTSYPTPIRFEMLTASEPMPEKSNRTLIMKTNQIIKITNAQLNTKIIRWDVNDNVFEDFKSPVLLDLISGARSRDVDWDSLNSTGYDNKRKTYPIKDNEVIDLVFQNTIGINGGCDYHPWHLHGHKFWDITFGTGTYPNGLNMNTVVKHPVARDTTLVYPDSNNNGSKTGDGCGWRLVRFIADNPGVWAAHCHIAPHMIMGMMVLFEEAIDKLPNIPLLPKY